MSNILSAQKNIQIGDRKFKYLEYGSVKYYESEDNIQTMYIDINFEEPSFKHFEKSPLDYYHKPLPYSNIIYETNNYLEFEKYLNKYNKFLKKVVGTGKLAFRVDSNLFFYNAGTPHNYEYDIYASISNTSDVKIKLYTVYETHPYHYKRNSKQNNNILLKTEDYNRFKLFILSIIRNKKIKELF